MPPYMILETNELLVVVHSRCSMDRGGTQIIFARPPEAGKGRLEGDL